MVRKLGLINLTFYLVTLVARLWMSAVRKLKTLIVKKNNFFRNIPKLCKNLQIYLTNLQNCKIIRISKNIIIYDIPAEKIPAGSAWKCSSKTAEILLDADGQCIPRFDIYQIPVALNCFKSHTNSLCLIFFFKKKMPGLKITLSDVTSFLPDNLSGLEKNYVQVWFGGRLGKFKGQI